MSAIVLIHGMWCHPEVAAPLAQRLSCEGHEVYCANLRNQDEDAVDQVCSFSEYVDRVEEQIRDQKFSEPPVLIGHSMGGLIAQMLASRIQTSGVILLNSAAPAGINHIFWSSFLSSANITFTPRFWNKANIPSFRVARYALFNQLEEKIAREIHATLRPESGRCFFEIVFWWLDRGCKTRIENSINAPMLIVSGGKDRIVHPRVAKALAKRYSSADWHYVNDCGHWIFYEESSAQVFEEVVRWIDDLRAAASRGSQTGSLAGKVAPSIRGCLSTDEKTGDTTLAR